MASKKVDLPVAARDVRAVAERLSPASVGCAFALEVCIGLECRVCLFLEPPRVSVEWRRVWDPLSGLRMRLPFAWAVACGRRVWEGRWRRGLFTVDRVECPVYLRDDCLYVEGRLVECGLSVCDAARRGWRSLGCEGAGSGEERGGV